MREWTGSDLYGDPLPKCAAARLGTSRFRHDGPCEALAFSPDGKILAGLCGYEMILWEAGSGRELLRMPAFPTGTYGASIDFSPNGKTIAVPAQKAVSLRDVASGRELQKLKIPDDDVRFVDGPRFSPNGKVLGAVVDSDYAWLFDVPTGKPLDKLPGTNSTRCVLLFSPDNRHIVRAGAEPSFQLWEVATGKLLWSSKERGNRFIYRAALTPDGKTLAGGGSDEIVFLDVASKRERGRVETKMGLVMALAYTPDGGTLVSASADGKVRLWDSVSHELRLTLDGRVGYARCLALSPDGRTVALGGDFSTVRLWAIPTGQELFTNYTGHEAQINCCGFVPGRKLLATGSDDGQIRLWDTANWKPAKTFKQTARAFGFAPDGLSLASLSDERTISIWNLATDRIARTISVAEPEWIDGLAWPNDVKVLVTLNHPVADPLDYPKGDSLVLWDVSRGVRLRQFFRKGTHPVSLALTYEGHGAILRDWKYTGMYNLGSGQEELTLVTPNHYSSAMAVSSDSRLLLEGQLKGDLCLWELATGKEIRRFPASSNDVRAVSFCPGGRFAASGEKRDWKPDSVPGPCIIRIWDLAAGKLVFSFEGPRSDITSLSFSPNGKYLVSAFQDSTVLVWDLSCARFVVESGPGKVGTAELEALWSALLGDNARRAHAAIWALVRAPKESIAFLRDHVRPVTMVSSEHLVRKLVDLDSSSFAVREAAYEELKDLGQLAVPSIRRFLQDKPSPEVRTRLQSLVKDPHILSPGQTLRMVHAIEVLERIGSPEALEILIDLSKGTAQARVTREAKAALERLKRTQR